MHLHDKQLERKRVNGLIARSGMTVPRGFTELGGRVFADAALSKKVKELMALAVAISQNCFD